MTTHIELGDLPSPHLPAPVPYAVITPPESLSSAPLPLCLFLMGGGGSRQNLIDCQPLIEGWWASGAIPPMILATPSAATSYYIDDPGNGINWGQFLSRTFPERLRQTHRAAQDVRSTAIFGISMGGYGALKTAFAYPDRFGVVAAMQPILEPGFHDRAIGPRNRLHHLSGGPANLVGPNRDPKVFEANNPANRLIANADAVRDSNLAIYLEVGDHDFMNAQDGTEFLHRVLWDFDLSHEYRLTKGGDHGGPTLVRRLRDALAWVGASLTAPPQHSSPSSPDERAVAAWIEGGSVGAPPTVDPSSDAFLTLMRAHLSPVRERALASDPTTARRFGRLGSGAGYGFAGATSP